MVQGRTIWEKIDFTGSEESNLIRTQELERIFYR